MGLLRSIRPRNDRMENRVSVPKSKFGEFYGLRGYFCSLQIKGVTASANNRETKVAEVLVETETDDILEDHFDHHIRDRVTKRKLPLST